MWMLFFVLVLLFSFFGFHLFSIGRFHLFSFIIILFSIGGISIARGFAIVGWVGIGCIVIITIALNCSVLVLSIGSIWILIVGCLIEGLARSAFESYKGEGIIERVSNRKEGEGEGLPIVGYSSLGTKPFTNLQLLQVKGTFASGESPTK